MKYFPDKPRNPYKRLIPVETRAPNPNLPTLEVRLNLWQYLNCDNDSSM